MIQRDQDVTGLDALAASLAKKVKVTQGYVSQLEAGTKKELEAKVAVRLADALGVPVTELLG